MASTLGLAIVALVGLHATEAAEAAAFPVAPLPIDRCAEPYGGVRPAEVTFLLATPREDTVPDAADAAGGAWGQLAEVERAGGAAGGRLDRAVEGDELVVLVPWGFDEHCRPIRWTGGWRWATPGAAGFYRGRLRPREDWIGGRPTLDVHAAVWEGFPESPWKHPMSAGRSRLSAAELFELYDRLPTAADIASRPYGAVAALVAWRRDAGVLAESYPARTLLSTAFELAERARVRTSTLPFGGTYRVRIEGPDDEEGVFYMRTGSAGSEPLLLAGSGPGGVPATPRPSAAYAAAAVLAGSLEEMETLPAEGRPLCHRDRGLTAAAEEVAPAPDGVAHAWPAELSLRLVSGCFEDDPVLGRLRALPPDSAEERDGEPEAAEPATAAAETSFAGSFRQEPDGRLTFLQPARLSDGREVLLVGERIGLDTMAPPPPLPSVRDL